MVNRNTWPEAEMEAPEFWVQREAAVVREQEVLLVSLEKVLVRAPMVVLVVLAVTVATVVKAVMAGQAAAAAAVPAGQ